MRASDWLNTASGTVPFTTASTSLQPLTGQPGPGMPPSCTAPDVEQETAVWPVASPHVLPVVVGYDHVGESFALYEWVTHRLKEEGLLQHANIAAPAIISIETFEALMALAAMKLCARIGAPMEGEV